MLAPSRGGDVTWGRLLELRVLGCLLPTITTINRIRKRNTEQRKTPANDAQLCYLPYDPKAAACHKQSSSS